MECCHCGKRMRPGSWYFCADCGIEFDLENPGYTINYISFQHMSADERQAKIASCYQANCKQASFKTLFPTLETYINTTNALHPKQHATT